MNKTVLLLPDLHHKVEQANKIIKHVGADEVICLGDVFDDFNDTPEMVQESCDWLNWFVDQPNHTFIAGNHEMSYMHEHCRCSGYDQWKSFIIQDSITKKTWDALKYYHILDDTWLLTHAGVHPQHLDKKIKSSPNILNLVGECLEQEVFKGHRNQSWVFKAGRARGGYQPIGGITWLDYNQEFMPIKGLNQIVGHTPQNSVPYWFTYKDYNSFTRSSDYVPTLENIIDEKQSHNVCLDVNGNLHYATWDGKELKIGNYRDL